MILLGSRKIFTLIMLFLTTLFFTFLTGYTAHFNKVLECGCFGDAIPMTPWTSFWKNIILLVLIAVLAIGNKHIIPIFGKIFRNILVFIFLASSTAFSFYCYNYLPVIDFRPYKVGTNIPNDMKGTPDISKYYYKLKNKKDGHIQEFEKFPDNYTKDWDYVGVRTDVIKKGLEQKIKDFSIVNNDGVDVTESILSNPDYVFLLTSMSLTAADREPATIKKINDLASACIKNNIRFICLTASGSSEINQYVRTYNAPYPFYQTDGTVLETMIRSNPGLMLIKKGTVIALWHYHSIPDFSAFQQQYLSQK
jgi:hypothetical protein